MLHRWCWFLLRDRLLKFLCRINFCGIFSTTSCGSLFLFPTSPGVFVAIMKGVPGVGAVGHDRWLACLDLGLSEG